MCVWVAMDIEYELSVKRVERNILRAELDDSELWESEEYQRLVNRIATLEAKLERSDSAAADGGLASESHG